MKKLTTPQLNLITELLQNQFKGNNILLGNRYGYNEDKLFIGQVRWSNERKCNIFNETSQIGSRLNVKSLNSLGVCDYLSFSYDSFYKAIIINIEKLKANFSNSNEAIINAFNNI
tara:strand:+ start:1325 stop:1669 length:345 start_codon:yes stop_codon:yes gene_type:complete